MIVVETNIKVNKKKENKSYSRPANPNNNVFFILITANAKWRITLLSIDILQRNF